MMVQGYIIFHLNLAFSSIKTEARPAVIKKCYWPLLDLIERSGIPIGIELTGWTLQQINLHDQSWVDKFRHMLECKQCELIGSGWSQIIGPLVPYEVNRWNQHLGLDVYQSIVGVKPMLALVNEMAFSSGMVNVYAEAGYQGLVMDRDNVRLALGINHAPMTETPTHAMGCGESSLPVLWADSVLFQRFQRAVHGDIPTSEYVEYVCLRARKDQTILPIYCNDAEIFDYRPGRFTTEARLHAIGEWLRMEQILIQVARMAEIEWLSPSAALSQYERENAPKISRLTTGAYPIPVKKQAKYNVNRWAVTGRDDLWLNTACHRLYRSLQGQGEKCADSWRALCELWASDLRTHITPDRWAETIIRIGEMTAQLIVVNDETNTTQSQAGNLKGPQVVKVEQDEEGIYWHIDTPSVHLVLNARRGLAIKSLSFASHNFEPIVGTLSQGYFSDIDLAADFYSGGVLVEVPGERVRVTDLEWVKPDFRQDEAKLIVTAKLPFGNGFLEKRITIDTECERVSLSFDFQDYERPIGVVRVGIFTLLPESFERPLAVFCKNGGALDERLIINQNVEQGHAASSLVSSKAAFGATDGLFAIEDARGRKLVLQWDPAKCAAIPMIKHLFIDKSFLMRISFSLCELDDTTKAHGRLLPFEVSLSVE